jgi:hypothetical protein
MLATCLTRVAGIAEALQILEVEEPDRVAMMIHDVIGNG